MGSMHTYAIAMAAWMSEIEKALNAPVGNPSGLVARSLLACLPSQQRTALDVKGYQP